MTGLRSLSRAIADRLLPRAWRLGRNTSGVAMIEAGLAIPLICLVGAAGLELTNLVIAYMRVADIAMKVADNAARVRVSIDESDINQVMIGAQQMGKSINFGTYGRVILSSVEPVMNSASPPVAVNQYLRWQRCYGANAANSSLGNQGDGATGTAQATGYGIPGKPKIAAVATTAVMLVEIVYDYQPLISNYWFGPVTIRLQQSMPVRQRDDQVVKNGGNLSASQEALCSNPHTA